MSIDISNFVRNVGCIKRIFFDIGSKTIKIAYISKNPVFITKDSQTVKLKGNYYDRLHCIQVDYSDFEAVLDYISNYTNLKGKSAFYAYTSRVVTVENLIRQKLGVQLICTDVFRCIVKGTNFLLKNLEAESYTYSFKQDKEYVFKTVHEGSIYPYIIVNIRTGVSIMRVDGPTSFKRIGGSSIGGGSFIGLCCLLTGEEEMENLMKMAESGNSGEFDKHISDVYGEKANTLGLPGDLLAASFAKPSCNDAIDSQSLTSESKSNIASSLLTMIAYNIAQIAYLYAEKENVNRVLFNGFLVRNRPIVMKTLSFAFNYWSSGNLCAFFLRHENYTSVIGAFLNSLELSDDILQKEKGNLFWKEHYSGSSALGRFVPTNPLTSGFKAETFEMDCFDYKAAPFTLLEDLDYIPDTIDFNTDVDARDFWLNVMSETIKQITEIAIKSQSNVDINQLNERANGFKLTFQKMLQIIKEKPFTYGNTNARNILELREQVLKQFGFDDIYLKQKSCENIYALKELKSVNMMIEQKFETIPHKDAVLFVCRCLLAGNVFDWGAKEVVKMMQMSGGLSFSDAIQNIQERPWLFDNYDDFYKNYKSYKSVMIFVDNSGCDYILGVIPFSKLFLRNGAKVIIVANTSPALNDLTYKEMCEITPDLANVDSEIKQFVENEQLMFAQNGQGSPCMDLRKVHEELNHLVRKFHTDFLVIEGMGRALHTNFNAKFKCDSLKAAVIKTRWLADRLGGKIFSVVFKWEKGSTFTD